LLVVLLAGAAGWYLVARHAPSKPVRAAHRGAVTPPTSARTRRHHGAKPSTAGEAPERTVGHLALVIDDLGRSLDEVAALDGLRVPLSYSVLPYEPMTPAVVARLRAEHREILCHLPMQPLDGRNPGPGALRDTMDDAALAQATRDAIARVPGAVGVNNHMGSRLTEDPRAMGAVLQVLQQEGLFFLDSRTSAGSVGYRLARSLGMPAAQRQFFLDDDMSETAIREQFARFLARARDGGAAIAIAHPHPGTLAVLREEVPKAQAEGFTFVPVSFLLDRTGEPL
jgi:polysaccharide deacetylase 2 family uncharacterized protein YibQ